jgi:hypothetical protein
MKKRMTINQIKKRYKSHWILLSDPKLVKGQLVSGIVVFHSKDRDKVYQKAIDLKLKHSATLCTITPPYPIVLAAA